LSNGPIVSADSNGGGVKSNDRDGAASAGVPNLRFGLLNRNQLFLWLAFIVVTLVAAFFRFHHLADVPLGLFFDPAINGLDALRFMQRGQPVIFLPTNGGREALLIYLLIPFLWLFDTTPFSFRLQLAFISLLNVVALFGFVMSIINYQLSIDTHRRLTFWPLQNFIVHRPLFRAEGPLWVVHCSLFASLTLAVSSWHIAVSRLDQRPLTVPLLAVLLFWFFLKGWITFQRRWFILAGLWLGLSFHTYSAARLLPLILLLTFLPELLAWLRSARLSLQPAHRMQRTMGLTLFVLTAVLVASPILWYFITHPAQFAARATSVMVWNFLDTPADIWAELGRNLMRVLGFFCCAGNAGAIFGLPGQPGLSPLLSPFLALGLIITLFNWRNLVARLLGLWWVIGIIPSIIAIEAPHPLRLIVALPATAILVGLGLTIATHWLRLWLKGQRFRWLCYAVPILLILGTIPQTYSAYFVRWPQLPVTQGIFDYGAIAIRDTILKHTSPNTAIYLPLARYNDAPLLYYLSGIYQRQAKLTAPSAEQALLIAPEKDQAAAVWVRLQGQTATLVPPLTSEGQQFIQATWAAHALSPIQTLRGETVAHLATLTTDPAGFVQQPTQILTATFGPARLIGAHYDPILNPNVDKFPVTLFWQALRPMSTEYEVLLQLVDDNHQVWGDGSARPNDWAYPTSFWQPGLDTVAVQHQVTLTPANLSPGRYWLAVALYNPATAERVPLLEETGPSPDTFFAGPLKLPPPERQPAATIQPIIFGNSIQLLNFTLANPTLKAGEAIHLDLWWQTLQPPPLDYTVFVHLLDASGALVAGNDSQPLNNRYPTSLWSPGEQILDPHRLTLPPTLPPGHYRLAVGLYDQPSGARLPLQVEGNWQQVNDALMLTPVITVP
jgi:hypothetical protein